MFAPNPRLKSQDNPLFGNPGLEKIVGDTMLRTIPVNPELAALHFYMAPGKVVAMVSVPTLTQENKLPVMPVEREQGTVFLGRIPLRHVLKYGFGKLKIARQGIQRVILSSIES